MKFEVGDVARVTEDALPWWACLFMRRSRAVVVEYTLEAMGDPPERDYVVRPCRRFLGFRLPGWDVEHGQLAQLDAITLLGDL